jgi:hypothetical protein
MAVVQGGVGVVPPLQRAVEAIAVEVERISEGQRFVTQIMAEREAPPSIGAGPR